MASIRFRNGKFQVQVRKHPHPPISGTFLTKVSAKAWARRIETQLDHGGVFSIIDADLLLVDLIARYRDEVTPLNDIAASSEQIKIASVSRGRVAKKMSSADISKAKRLARDCVKKNYKGC